MSDNCDDPNPWMFSPADFPASRTPLLVDVADLPTSATCGRSSPESFAQRNPDGSWRKTCQGFSQVTLDGSLERFSETWPRAGMTRSGIAYLLSPLAPLIVVTASGLLPTPSAIEVENPNKRYVSTTNAEYPDGRKCQPTLSDVIARGLWPTPRAAERNAYTYDQGDHTKPRLTLTGAVKWRTPQAGDGNGGGQDARKRRASGHQVYLRDQVKTLPTPTARMWKDNASPSEFSRHTPDSAAIAGGSLNPTWVEWLMGYPLGWTDCGDSATASSRRSRSGSPNGSKRRKQ